MRSTDCSIDSRFPSSQTILRRLASTPTVGSGKTMLLRRLQAELDREGRVLTRPRGRGVGSRGSQAVRASASSFQVVVAARP